MSKRLLYLILGFFFLVFSQSVFAQSSKAKELRKEKEKIEQEIVLTNKLLKETKHNKKTSLHQLNLINKRIKQRQRLINNIRKEIRYIDATIGKNKKQINVLEKEIKQLKKEYARLIRAAYYNNNKMTRLAFIFASDNFYQAVQRVKYLNYYSNYRRKQSEMILQKQDSIVKKNNAMKKMRKEKVALQHKEELEKSKVVEEKEAKNKTVRILASKEKKLLKSIKKKKRAAQKLENTIRKIIEEQIEVSGGKEVVVKETPKSKPKIKKDFRLTPKEKKLSSDFSANKRKLPWPTAKGVISSSFGSHAHPVLKYIKTKNNGINIITSKGAKARAVFKGKVTHVMQIPNQNYVVFIRHGRYLTVYANLDSVDVKFIPIKIPEKQSCILRYGKVKSFRILLFG
ncbi:MAG: hypothetical protein CSA94_00085 [Bacteroidetes bacterium]|nr:MAG: hypothetical protein CSA94_00085 [Bacteroidota bacterium]